MRRLIAAIFGYSLDPQLLSKKQRAKINRCYEIMLRVYRELENEHRFGQRLASAAEQINLAGLANLPVRAQ
ncbi:MAG TPA: hypothetical protein VFE46_01615 [Pirellulales bacterium]|nr:hypothetical protein [Pirellulales bacterium]